MGKTIGIVSGKGGVGKSTVTASLALLLGKNGKKVCVVDGDNGMRSLDILLNVENRVVYDISDVAENICPMRRAVVATEYENVSMLSANASSDTLLRADMLKVINGLRSEYDYVFIDGPAGTGAGFTNVLACSDTLIIVTTADPIAVRDAERVSGIAKHAGIAETYLLLNRQTKISERRKNPLSPDEITHRTDLLLIGRIPEDKKIIKQDHPSQKGKAAKALKRIALRIDGCETPIPKKVTGLFG